MDPRIEIARLRALEFVTKRFAASVDLTPVDALPMPVYGFDPEGWIVFACADAQSRVGGTGYVAVNAVTREVKVLGRLGE